MNIVLIGFMGSGKSTIAKNLAQKLGMKVADMDNLTVEASGRKNIKQIFEKDGETAFRELEIKIAKKIAKKDNQIIATGGGAIMNKIILDYLKMSGKVIYLKTSIESIFTRIRVNGDRPLFQNFHEIKRLFKLREPLYKAYSDIIVVTDKKNLDQVVEEVLTKYGR